MIEGIRTCAVLPRPFTSAVLGLVLAAQITPVLRGDQVLFEFTRFEISRAVLADAKVTLTPLGTLRVATGREQPWPGVTLRAPTGHWDLSNSMVGLMCR
jgi:hypothetical protein